MNSNKTNLPRFIWGLVLGLALVAGITSAQDTTASNKTPNKSSDDTKTEKSNAKKPAKAKKADTEPTQQTVGEDAGNFKIVSSIEFGYRGQRVDGDVNKFKSDLNYKAGPRLFDTSFLAKSKTGGKGDLFDTFLVTSTGWGADPSGSMRIDVEKPEWYRFEGQYRRFKYYRFLNNIANPTWFFSPNPTPANPVTGLHGYDIYTQMGDFDLTILPKNETIRFNVGYSPERYSGPFYTNYHNGGNDFWLLSNARSRANDWRLGADGKIGKVDWTFVQGFRRFRDDSVIPLVTGLNRNVAQPPSTLAAAQFTSFLRQEPTRGSLNYTRGSIHTFLDNKFDLTGRIIYSRTTSNSTYIENFTGTNFNFRVTATPTFPPSCSVPSVCANQNAVNPSFYNIAGNVKRPNTVGDIGFTYLVTDKFRLSNTFRVEDFTIDGIGTFSDFLSITRPLTAGGSRTDTFTATNAQEFLTTHYRKYQNTLEGDYQINPHYAFHFGYRYGHRRDERIRTGADLTNSGAPPLNAATSSSCMPNTVHCVMDDLETNNTNAFFGGFKAHPSKNFTLYFDAEHGTADNVFTRIGNYDYTNVRAKSRWTPNRKVNLNLGFILRDNSNPSEIASESLSDFGVNLKTRIFTSSIDWMPNPRFTISTGYNYNWVNSDAVIDYLYAIPPASAVRHSTGHALYYQRLSYFFIDVTARLNRRMTLYTSYRLNDDNGQGNRLSDPAGTPGTLITSYPMSFNSPEARLAIVINRHLDWNLGYQYYSYNESDFLTTFPGSLRAQNYHAHLPYMSLRLYFGRKE